MDSGEYAAIALINRQLAEDAQKIAALQASLSSVSAQLAAMTAEVNRICSVLKGI